MKNQLLFIALSTALFACDQTSSSPEVTLPQHEDIPAGAIREPYADRPEMEKVTLYSGESIIAQGDYINGKKAGIWTEFQTNGQVQMATSYVDGLKNGVTLKMDNQGKVEERTYYHNDVKHGDYIKYKHTKVIAQISYVDGKKEGAVKKFYDNGTIQEESNYSNDVLHGVAIWYDQEGNVLFEYEYDEGKLIKQ
jgi:antitoxin component YwqK of YwqJK toxin-antitoxin module